MPKFEVRKIVVMVAEIEAPTEAEAIKLADEYGYGDFQLADTRFVATDPIIAYTQESLEAASNAELRARISAESTRPSAKRDRLVALWREKFDHLNDIRRGMGLPELPKNGINRLAQ